MFSPDRNATESVETIANSWLQQVRGFSDGQELSAAKKEAKQYFNSKLHAHDTAKDNSLHGSLRSILRATEDRYCGHARNGINYRVNHIMGTATLYKDFLDIDYPACHEVDVEKVWCGKDGVERI